MEWFLLLGMAAGLSMDAFAVSMCNGLAIKGLKKRHMFFIAISFGFFQGVMPLTAYFLGYLFLETLSAVLPYISFTLLAIIGGNMIYSGIRSLKGKSEETLQSFKFSSIIIQGVATSIDAFAVGISLLAFNLNVFICVAVITLITFSVCFAGVFAGSKFSLLMKGKNGIAELSGGIVLVLIGITFLF